MPKNLLFDFRCPFHAVHPHLLVSIAIFTFNIQGLRQYVGDFPNLLDVEVGKERHWPAVSHIFEGHRSVVASVVFSPDGKQIASGSYDHTIRVWDAANGQVVSGPFEGPHQISYFQ
jgi:WD40 repeat protein